jgi:hypothetical protein
VKTLRLIVPEVPNFFLRLSVFSSTLEVKQTNSHYPKKMMAFLFARTLRFTGVGGFFE